MQIETVFENNWRPKNELTFIVLGFEFRKHPKLDLTKLVFIFKNRARTKAQNRWQGFRFQKIIAPKNGVNGFLN